MNNKELDEEILLGIRTGGITAEKALCQLYDLVRALISGLVQNNQGTRDEAFDVLQDSLVIVYEQIRNGQYVHQSKLSTYVYSVARHIWLNRLKRKKIEARILDYVTFDEVQESPLTEILLDEHEKQIQLLFGLLGADCRKLLVYVIYDNLSMREVVENMHYENEQVVRNKKYKCLKQLKEILSTRPEILTLLKS